MQNYAMTHDANLKPLRSQTAKGALAIARGWSTQGKRNIQISTLEGEVLSLPELQTLVDRIESAKHLKRA